MSKGREKVAVAVRTKQLLATAFHPELTDDPRWYAPAWAHTSDDNCSQKRLQQNTVQT